MSKPDKRINSVDVARLAGVSQSTVSRVFSPNANVSEEKRQRVLAAAQELGYQPNIFARSLITRSSNVIGIVVADISSHYYAYFLGEFNRRLNALGKQTMIITVDAQQPADEMIPVLLQYQVDALVIAATTLSGQTAVACAEIGTPLILFNQAVDYPQVSSICVDNRDGGQKVADLFVEGDHRVIGYVAGLTTTQSNQLREQGFVNQLAIHGVHLSYREQGDYSYESGFAAVRQMLSQVPRPTAIFCASDIMAMGGIDAAREAGVSIPAELSIVGFDDIPSAGWAGYQLTTVRQPMNRLIDITVDALQRQIEDNRETVYRLLPGELIRRSTG